MAIPERSRVLVLTPEAFGGHGGIALYNEDLLTALCQHPDLDEVVALARHGGHGSALLPSNLRYRAPATGAKVAYLKMLAGALWRDRSFQVVICGHLNLLPLAWLAAAVSGAPLWLVIYGIDAWTPPASGWTRQLVTRLARVISISTLTLDRFQAWAKLPPSRTALLPNAIHAERYGPGPKPVSLLSRYDLSGKAVLMTLGRLVDTERYKGIDEVLEALPGLRAIRPNLTYLIVGDGTDRPRLEHKVAQLGLTGHVVFAGRIPEGEKADHYRLADAYVMPSHGEGFGFVFLEAMACGLPVVASATDGGREAVREGLLGQVVDPADGPALQTAILRALEAPRGVVPDGLDHFSFERFAERLHRLPMRAEARSKPYVDAPRV